MRPSATMLLCAALACAQAGCRTTSPAATVGPLPVDLPMHLRGSEPVVEVLVNGQGPFLFAIDTGATDFARVDSSLVARLGLRITGSDTTNDGSGRNSRTFGTVNLATLTVGSIEFHGVEAMTRDYNRYPSLPAIDGILTFDLFADYLLTLDYPAGRVRIEKGRLPPADGREVLRLARIKGLPAVEVTIGDRMVTAEIDSGDIVADFLLPASLMKSLRLASDPVPAGKGRTVSNEFELERAELDGSIRLGEHEFRNPTVTFPAVFDFPNIGSPALRDFAVTFDQRNDLVRFIRRSAPARKPRD